MAQKILVQNLNETQKLAEKIAKKLKGKEVLALVGNLGSGKTAFVQALARALGIKERVISPTFVIQRIYPVPRKKWQLLHYDFYRLNKEEVYNIDFLDQLGKNLVVIEWAEKIKEFLPKESVWIKIKNLGGEKREFKIS